MAHDYRCQRCQEEGAAARLVHVEITTEGGTRVYRLCADCGRKLVSFITKGRL